MTENTNLLKQILEEKKLSREKERVKLLNTTIDVVQRVAPQYSGSSVYNLINSVRWSSPKLRFCVFKHAMHYNHPRVCQKLCHGSVHLLTLQVP